MGITVSLLAFILVLFLKFYISRSYIHQKQPALGLPPGPWQLPLIGSLHHFLLSRFRELPHKAMREISKTHGPLMLLRLGTVPTLVVSSADAAKEILKTHDLRFCDHYISPTADIMSCSGQDIAYSPYNERWVELRKICTLELFNQRRVVQFRHVREDEVARLIQAVAGEWSSGKPIDLSEKIFCLVNDTVMRITIGSRCKYQDEFFRELENVVRLVGGFNLVDLYPSSKLIRWLSASSREISKCHRKMYHVIDRIIHERATTVASEQDDDLLGVLLRLQKEGRMQFALTNEIISAVIFDVFFGGTDTVSTTLEWAVSELMKHPHVLYKAQSEVRDIFKGQRIITEDKMDKLSYLRSVIKETLRLHPPAPLIPRKCRETCQVMGYDVLKGVAVAVNVWAIGRDNKYWDAAEEFRPERFENSSIGFKGTDFEFIPFGSGRRMCPGSAFGRATIELALASLLYHFDWELPVGVNTEDLDMTETFGLTVRRKSKLLLHARPHILHDPN